MVINSKNEKFFVLQKMERRRIAILFHYINYLLSRMRTPMKKILFVLSLSFVMLSAAYSCFDTYLFVHRGSMVYPRQTSVIELLGEYSVMRVQHPGSDSFFSTASFFYGVTDRFSTQISIGSSERQRDDFRLDSYGIRGVINAYTASGASYTLDVISEYHSRFNGEEREVEISFPNIFHSGDMLFVVHPTVNHMFDANENAIGGHAGMFYNVDEKSIVGVGAEYASTFTTSFAQSKLTASELSASVFFGTHLGTGVYVQNELAKGLYNARDFGFALTTKIIL